VSAQRIWTIAHAAQRVRGEPLGPLDDELRWLAALLTPVRDLDTLVAHLRPQVETLGEDADGATLVIATLERQRSFRRNELRAAVASPRFAERQLRKLRRTAGRLDDASSDAALYVLQLRAQRARYSAELLGGAKAARYVKALARVQELARKHEDAVAAEGWLRSLSRPKTALAVGRLIEREEFRKRAQRAALPAALATALRLGRGVF
jgi:CHAD domain-containing protein